MKEKKAVENLISKIKKLKIIDYFKYFSVFIIFLIGIIIIIAIFKFFVLSILGLNNKYYSEPLIKNQYYEGKLSYAPYTTPSDKNRLNYWITIESSDLNKDLESINEYVSENKYKVLEKRISNKFANLVLLVPKKDSDKFLKFLNNFNIKNINSNQYSLEKSYNSIIERIEFLENRKKYLMERLGEIKKNYDEIIRLAIENKDPKALNSAYTSLYSQENQIWSEINKIDKEIRDLENQLKKYEEENNYVEFHIYIYENKIINLESYKEEWKNEIKLLFDSFNDTLVSVIVGVPIFLVKAIKYVIYTILTLIITLFTLKIVWVIIKRILGIKNI